MKTVRISQVVACHDEAWGKWPDTQDTDYSDVLAKRWQERYCDNETEILVDCRYYPVYWPYLVAGTRDMPIMYPWIDNTKSPTEGVLDAMAACLHSMPADSIQWWHAQQCYPFVAACLERDFRFRFLAFGDDCPGSSDIKTFPVAPYFNGILHTMGVWDPADGTKTRDKYRRLGCEPYLVIGGATNGLEAELERMHFSLEDKAQAIEEGKRPPVDFLFVGFAGGMPWRCRLLADLNSGGVSLGSCTTRLHGVGMRDGVLEPRLPTSNSGAAIARAYADALYTCNPQQSSLYNTRLIDCMLTGVVQLCMDPWGELADLGLDPFIDYLPFGGQAADIVAAIEGTREASLQLGSMIRRGGHNAARIARMYGPSPVRQRLYLEHFA